MQHFGGPGATSFGNDDNATSPDDADHDIILTLDRWVTQGIAPDRIIAAGKIGTGTHMARPLCVYPATAHYKGQGDK